MSNCTELVGRARRGDLTALDELVRCHYSMIWRIARQFAHTREDADDLAQEAFVVACERLHTLAEPDRFGPWLAAIARNLGRMWLRRHLAQPALLSLDGDGPAVSAALEGPSAQATCELASREAIRHAVAGALAALRPGHRQALRLHYLLGYDYAETAALLDIPIAAVRGRLHRARSALRKELREMVSAPVTEWQLDERDLGALRTAANFASTSADPRHSPITGILVADGARLISSDMRRLFHYASPSFRGIPSVVIHADLARTLRDRYPRARRARLTLGEDEAILRLDEGEHIRASIVDSRYPAWEKVVPDSWAMRATATVGDWLTSLEFLARQRETAVAGQPEAPERLRVLIVLSPQEGTIGLRLGAEPPPGLRVSFEASVSFAATFEGSDEETVIAANARYVEEAVRALGLQPDAQIEFAANLHPQPFLLKPAGAESVFVITMPMQRPSDVMPRAR